MTRRPGSRARLSLAPVALALVLAACARVSVGPSASTVPPGGIQHPLGADQLVLRVDAPPGQTINPATVVDIPSFSLFGDGTVVTPGPQVEIYPPPALPSLLQRRVTEAGVQTILKAAQQAGLLGPDATYSTPPIPEASLTTFIVDAGGSTHTVRVLALGGGVTDDTPYNEVKARQALSLFDTKLRDLPSWLPAGSVGTETPYALSRLQVSVQPGAPLAGPGMVQQALDWPLSPGLTTWGSPQQGPGPVRLDVRCGAAGARDLQRLLPLAMGANALTAWRSDGALFALRFMPLLPDQQACPPSAAI
jgi:hypothetical protein